MVAEAGIYVVVTVLVVLRACETPWQAVVPTVEYQHTTQQTDSYIAMKIMIVL